jgi:hypothetical protein
MKRNLLFFCYFPNNETNFYIEFNIKMLEHYKDVFTGEKHICIALDDISVDLDKYSSYFNFLNPTSITFILNQYAKNEVLSFIELSNKLKYDNSITFYAHSKNASKYLELNNTALHNWLFSMYYFNLENSYLESTDIALNTDKIFSGSFRKNISCPPEIKISWHYSGTFFWFNTKKIMEIENWNSDFDLLDRYGIEGWPGKIVDINKSNVSFYESPTNYNLLLPNFWDVIFSYIDTTHYSYLYKTILNKLK